MVSLNRITTRTGDDGSTGLADGSRLPKQHPLIVALGELDELNALLGLVAGQQPPPVVAAALPVLQNDLFDLGADLSTPPGGPHEARIPRITPAQVQRLEAWLAEANARLPPLRSFVLPGGSPPAAWLHLARTVARRAERSLCAAQAADPARAWNGAALPWLNRLSDLLFVWARLAGAEREALWRPGGGPEVH